MTTENLLATTRIHGQDLFGRMELMQVMIEQFVKEGVKIPPGLNFRQVLLLARMAKDPNEPVKAADLTRRGYYAGSNVSYNLNALTDLQFLEKTGDREDRRVVMIKLTNAGREFGSKVAQQLAFVEENIGSLFGGKELLAGRSFLVETVFGGELNRPTAEAPKERVLAKA